MNKKFIILISLFLVLSGFRLAEKFLFVVPDGWPNPVYNFEYNELSEAKISLGRALFYDPILSRDNTISCASCHSQYNAFTHVDHALSHGIDDKIGIRNSPTLMNLAWQHLFMRDGAINHLDMQALAPISDSLEMDETIEHVAFKLQSSPIYPSLYYEAYSDSAVTGERTLKAISQFLLTLVSSNSKYDSVMRKEAVYTDQESNGYKLFKENCSSCHSEPLFTNDRFMNNGLGFDSTLNDLGRFRVTLNPVDSFKFKVPSLRNIEFSYPYMHDGRFKRLSDVMKHYTSEVAQSSTLAPDLKSPMVLSSRDKVDLIAFLLTLTDREFLFNPDYSFPKDILLNQAKG